MMKFFQGVMRCLKSGYAWVRKWWQVFTAWLAGLCGEPERPDFSLCKTPEELKAKVDVYVARCKVWQEHERKRLLNQDNRLTGMRSRIRALLVIVAAVVTLCLVHWTYRSWVTPYQCCTGYLSLAGWLDFFKSSTGAVLLAAPVAYLIWWFRDVNSRHLIENQRKDTNLKDFQQLCQWASGEHLKTDDNRGGSMVASGNPLQISAADQLVPYMRGEFGSTFRRPAFKMLMAMWRGLSKEEAKYWQQTERTEDDSDAEDDSDVKESVQDLQNVTSAAVSEARGAFIYEHLSNRRGYDLSGIEIFGALDAPLLLAGANWGSVGLNYARLSRINLQGSRLFFCSFNRGVLQKVDLTGAELRGCGFFNASVWSDLHCESARFYACQFNRADIRNSAFSLTTFEHCSFHVPTQQTYKKQEVSSARISGSNFSWTKFVVCGFVDARLTRNNFFGAQFIECAAFEGVEFNDCNFEGTTIDGKTNFDGATFDAKTKWSEPSVFDPDADMQPLTRELAIARGATVLSATEG